MRTRKGLILDANILIRGVFGRRVLEILKAYEDQAHFYSPEACFEEARQYIPSLSLRRGIDASVSMAVLEQLSRIVEPVHSSLYEDFREAASRRVRARDPKDWPVLAVALLLGHPIWTEDQDFFGSGIPTWTTDRVELYLRDE